MICLGCQRPRSQRWLCRSCARDLVAPPDRILPGGLRVVGAFEHRGVARDLVGGFKYRGVPAYADLVAGVVAQRIPDGVLVPVPRCGTRLLRYGIDPALELAKSISRVTGSSTASYLRRPIHSQRRAGRNRSVESNPMSAITSPQVGLVLVDDVVTTGATALAAARALGLENVRAVVAANLVREVSSLVMQTTPPKVSRT